VVDRLAFPNREHAPASSAPLIAYPFIARHVLLKFPLPELESGGWRGSEATFLMSVPETAVHEDRCTVLRQDDVGPTRQFRNVHSEAKPGLVQVAAHKALRHCVPSPNRGHHARPCLLIDNVSHGRACATAWGSV